MTDRSRLPLDERRSRLLALGVELFSRHSYDELSVDDIAKQAGISKGLLYHYFDGKRGFYVESVRQAARDLRERVESAIDVESDPLNQLRAGIRAYLGYVGDHARAYVALLRGGIGYDPEVAAIVDETREFFLNRLLRDFEHPPDPPLRNALRGFVGFVEAASLDWAEHRDLRHAEVATLLLKMAEHTIVALGEAQAENLV